MGAWDKTKPVTGTNIVDIPGIFENNWDALEDITGEEHYTFTNALSGRHKPGEWPVFYSGTTSQINALSATAGSGALAWDTTLGLGKICEVTTADVWDQVNLLAHSRVSAYRSADVTLTTTSEVTVSFNTETFDSLNEFSTTTYIFTTTVTGYYLIRAQLAITPSEGGISYDMSIKHTTTASATILQLHSYRYSLSTDEMTMKEIALLPLSAGDLISITIQPDTVNAGTIEGGSDRTFLKIYRLS